MQELRQLLKLLYNIDINYKWGYDKTATDYEKEINSNTDKVKIQICSKWIYINFSDKATEEDFKKRLEGEGYKIRKFKQEGSCYEIYGSNKDGKDVEIYFNPVDGAIVKSKSKSKK